MKTSILGSRMPVSMSGTKKKEYLTVSVCVKAEENMQEIINIK